MNRSIHSVRQSVKSLRNATLNVAGRNASWWFDDILALAASSRPSALTGNQIAALFGLDLCGMKAIQVTVQPQGPDSRVSQLVSRCPLIGRDASSMLSHVQRDIEADGMKFHCAVGTALNPTKEEIKVYIGCADDGDNAGLSELLSRSGFMCPLETSLAQSLISSAKATCLFIGAGRRFGARSGYTFYFSSGGEIGFRHIDDVALPLGKAVVARFKTFHDGINEQSIAPIRWGWAITLSEDGRLRSLKLEATPSSGGFRIARLMPTPDAEHYRWLKRVAIEIGAELHLQTVSCTLEPSGWGGCRYFKLDLAEGESMPTHGAIS